jgi:hypothetical protein
VQVIDDRVPEIPDAVGKPGVAASSLARPVVDHLEQKASVVVAEFHRSAGSDRYEGVGDVLRRVEVLDLVEQSIAGGPRKLDDAARVGDVDSVEPSQARRR